MVGAPLNRAWKILLVLPMLVGCQKPTEPALGYPLLSEDLANENNAPLSGGRCAGTFELEDGEGGVLWTQGFSEQVNVEGAVPEVRLATDDCGNVFVATGLPVYASPSIRLHKFFPNGDVAWPSPLLVGEEGSQLLGALAVDPSGVVLISSWDFKDELFEYHSDGSRIPGSTSHSLKLGVNLLKRWDESWLAAGSGLGRIELPSGYVQGGSGLLNPVHGDNYFTDATPMDTSRVFASRVRLIEGPSAYRREGDPPQSPEDVTFELSGVVRSMASSTEDIVLWSDEDSRAPLSAVVATDGDSQWLGATWAENGSCDESWVRQLGSQGWEWQSPQCLLIRHLIPIEGERLLIVALSLESDGGHVTLVTLSKDGRLLDEKRFDDLPALTPRGGSSRSDLMPFDAALYPDNTLAIAGYRGAPGGESEFVVARLEGL